MIAQNIRYPFQFAGPLILVGIQYKVDERPIELELRLRHISHLLFAKHSPVHADDGAKVSGSPAKVRCADREQARLAVGHQDFTPANLAVGAISTLTYYQFDQTRKPEAHTHRTRVVYLDLIR